MNIYNTSSRSRRMKRDINCCGLIESSNMWSQRVSEEQNVEEIIALTLSG